MVRAESQSEDAKIMENAVRYAKLYTHAPITEVESVANGPKGPIVTVHCYEIVREGDDAHTATWDHIDYDASAVTITDFFGKTTELAKLGQPDK